jgi:membrane protease YdiL (CAAX protease family)
MQRLSRRFSGFVFLYVVIAYIAYTVLFNFVLTDFNTFLADNSTIIILIFRLVIFLAPIIFIAAKKYPATGVLRLNTFSIKQLLFACCLSICLYLFINTFGSIINNLYAGLFLPDLQLDYFSATGFSIWPGILTSCLIPAVLYELIFRGAVQSGFRNIFPLKGCLFVGILFGLFQLNLLDFLQYAVYGFILCYMSNKSGSIIPGMLTAFLVLFFRVINLSGWLYFNLFAPSGMSQDWVALIMAFVSTMIGGLLLWKTPDTSNTSRPIGMPKIGKIGQLIKKLPEFRRRLQQSYLSDHAEDESKENKKRPANEPANTVLSVEEVYPNNGPGQNRNTGFVIGSIILTALTLFVFACSIIYYLKMAS